jgi:hypothetical protein
MSPAMASGSDAPATETDGGVTLHLEVLSTRGAALASLPFEVRLVVLGGYAARDPQELERHMEELRQIGIDAPEQVPAFWSMGRHLVTTGRRIEVQGRDTSGEIEYALLFHQGRTYVAAASDHTDRKVETYSIPRSKQLCAKVLSRQVVPLEEVQHDWDSGALHSDVLDVDGAWLPYQRAGVDAMLSPDALVEACFGRGASVPEGTVLCSGTVSIVDGETRYAPAFRGGLRLPGNAGDLRLEYAVDVLPEQADFPALGGVG